MSESFRPCILVPTRNHVQALPALLDAAKRRGVPVLVVDDGSDAVTAGTIDRIIHGRDTVSCLRHVVNEGKGVAVLDGLRALARRGFTHALQIDADGQHELEAVPHFLAAAAQHPDAVIAGQPVFDRSIPPGRRLGRWITHFWVMIHILSLRTVDTMCGFRVYPIAPTVALADLVSIGRRMDFDTEILVRLAWAGTPVAMLPVRVVYPPGNFSNFRLVADNVAISAMHTRLLLGMLRRLPQLVRRRPQLIDLRARAPVRHWAELGERGSYWGLLLLMAVYRCLGRRLCRWLMMPAVLFFFLTGSEQRRGSAGYLRRLHAAGHLRRPPSWVDQFRHFSSFAVTALDTVAAWSGDVALADLHGAESGAFAMAEASPAGAFVLTAHLGNPQVIRAVGDRNRMRRVTVLVHTLHADRFNRLIGKIAPHSNFRVLQITGLGVDKAILLKEAIDAGEWVVSVADRVPFRTKGRIVWTPFLGEPAPFPQGPFVLAALLGAPVYTMFCLREGPAYRIHFEKLADRLELPRAERQALVAEVAGQFVARLEACLITAPLQWHNFFDFWHQPGLDPPSDSASRPAAN